jgi:hypothetical protein
VAIAAHHHDVFDEDGKVPVDLFRLWDIGDEVLLQGFANAHAEHADFARGDGHEAHDRLEKGGFAGAVDADQRSDGSGRNGKARMAQGRVAIAIGDRHILCGDAFAAASRARSHDHPANPFTMVETVTFRRSR